MSLRAFKCVAQVTIHSVKLYFDSVSLKFLLKSSSFFAQVSAPGARLANKEDLYLNVFLLGQQRRTRLVSPNFPLLFSDELKFEKVI
jgi:hypothetical protein